MTLVAPTPTLSDDREHSASPQRSAFSGEAGLERELDMLAAHDQAMVPLLMEVSLDGIWMWDLEVAERSWASPRFWEMLGYDRAQTFFSAFEWSRLLHPESSEGAWSRFVAYCDRPDHIYDEVLPFSHRGGDIVWLRCRGIALRDAAGRPVRLLGALQDMTILKRTEAELRRGQAELTEALAKAAQANAWQELAEQVARVGHWRINLTDRTVTWSNEIYRMHGRSPDSGALSLDDAIGFYHPDDRSKVEATVQGALRDGRPFAFSARLVRLDGDVRHVQCRAITRLNAQGVVESLFGVLADISEQNHLESALRKANTRLEALANVDSLTGLANRRRFDEILLREWHRASRDETPLSLVMVDIDRFKGFNDRYGHLAGDECLRRVADVLAERGRRPSDVAARYGGEEMVLLLPCTSATGAELVARECRSAIAALGIWHEGNMSCGGIVTASFGVATALPSEDCEIRSLADLLGEADRLLYEAKRTGRNKVVTQSSFFGGGAAPTVPDEEARLSTLARYQAAGATRRTQEMDGIARLAATLTGAPIAMVSYITRDRKHLIGNFNLPGADSIPRDISFCTHTILGDEPMVIANATHDIRFRESPVVTGDLGFRYYAGAPVVSQSTGHKLGTLCVVDTIPHEKTGLAERAILTDLANMVAALMEDDLKTGEVIKEKDLLF